MFTTKVHKHTGLMRLADNGYADIKHKRKKCGFVSGNHIWFCIKDNSQLGWSNKRLKKEFNTFEDAVKWVRECQHLPFFDTLKFLD